MNNRQKHLGYDYKFPIFSLRGSKTIRRLLLKSNLGVTIKVNLTGTLDVLESLFMTEV